MSNVACKVRNAGGCARGTVGWEEAENVKRTFQASDPPVPASVGRRGRECAGGGGVEAAGGAHRLVRHVERQGGLERHGAGGGKGLSLIQCGR